MTTANTFSAKSTTSFLTTLTDVLPVRNANRRPAQPTPTPSQYQSEGSPQWNGTVDKLHNYYLTGLKTMNVVNFCLTVVYLKYFSFQVIFWSATWGRPAPHNAHQYDYYEIRFSRNLNILSLVRMRRGYLS